MSAFAYSLGRNRADAHPQVRNAASFDELQDGVLSARHDRPKEEAPYFARAFGSNGAAQPQRAREYAEPCAWIALDVDRLTPDAEPRLKAALVSWRGFWHASMSATADNLKRRVVLECSRVVTLDEHPRVVAAVEALLRERIGDGVEFDHAASGDLARLWYLPTENAAAGFFVGEPLDVDRALAYRGKADEAQRERPSGDRGKTGEGGRNVMLTREAGKLRRLGLSPKELVAALHQINAERCDPPLDDAEVETIARSVGRYAPGDTDDKPRTDDERTGWPDPLDLKALALRDPQPPQFIVADWLPVGYATLLSGHGGVGKSAIGLHQAVCTALGLPFFGVPTERRRVLYLSCEDRDNLLHWRLSHICAHLNISIADLAGKLDILDLVGHDAILWDRDPRTGYTVTPAFGHLAKRMHVSAAQVLVVDGVSDTFGGNENARPEVKRYVNALLSLVPANDGALLLLGHVAKPTATNASTSEGYSGSTQWHNAVRARWYLYPETENGDDNKRPQRTGKLLLELQKSNLGRIDRAMTFAWDADAHMFLATDTLASATFDREDRERMEQAGTIRAFDGCGAPVSIIVPAAMQGRRTAFNVLSKRPEFPDSLRRSPRRFWEHIEHLRQLKLIEEREYRRPDGHRAVQLVLTPEGKRRIDDIEK